MGWQFHVPDANHNRANGNATALRTTAVHHDLTSEEVFPCSAAEPAPETAEAADIPAIAAETNSDGHAKVLASFGQVSNHLDLMNTDFKRELAKGPGRSIFEPLPWTPRSLPLGGPWITSLRNALIKYPGATFVWVPSGSLAAENGAKSKSDQAARGLIGGGST